MSVSQYTFGDSSHQPFFFDKAVFPKKIKDFFRKNSFVKIKNPLGDGSFTNETAPTYVKHCNSAH